MLARLAQRRSHAEPPAAGAVAERRYFADASNVRLVGEEPQSVVRSHHLDLGAGGEQSAHDRVAARRIAQAEAVDQEEDASRHRAAMA